MKRSLDHWCAVFCVTSLILAGCLIADSAKDERSDDYRLERSTFSMAGGISQSEDYRCTDTVGEWCHTTGAFGDAYDESTGFWSGNPLSTDVMDEMASDSPAEFRLNHNYPNPFNPETTVAFDVKEQSMISLRVYDVRGRVVETLVDEIREAGSYRVRFDASALPSGIYFYKIGMKDFSAVGKMVLME